MTRRIIVCALPRQSLMILEWENQPFVTAFAGNTHETIVDVHGSFAVLFSPLFSWRASNPERSHKGGVGNGTVSNRDFLSIGSGLSEISSTLATGILDGSSATFLSLQTSGAKAAALFR